MRKLTKFLVLGTIGAVMLPGISVFAQTTQTRDMTGKIVVTGLTDYGKYNAEIVNQPTERSVSANACGVIRLASSTSVPIAPGDSLNIAGTSVEVSTLAVGAAPACTNGSLTNTANLPAGNTWKDSNGNIYQRNLPAYNPVTVIFEDVPQSKSVSANACGLATLPTGISGQVIITDRDSSAQVATFDSTTLTPTLETPFCRNGVTYFPEGFAGGS